MKLGIGDVVEARVGARPLDERARPFHAHRVSGAARQREGEVAEAAEQIQHHRVVLELQQLCRPLDQRGIDGTVHLDEVGRRKFQLHAGVPQAVAQRLPGGVQLVH